MNNLPFSVLVWAGCYFLFSKMVYVVVLPGIRYCTLCLAAFTLVR